MARAGSITESCDREKDKEAQLGVKEMFFVFLNILNLLFPLCLLARLLPFHCPISVKTFQRRGLFRPGSVHFPPLDRMTSPDICYPVSFFSPSQLPTPIHSDKNPLHFILAN